MSAADRVAEFARQWRMKRDAEPTGLIYSIHIDPEADPAELNVNDLAALVAERDSYRRAKAENDERYILERDEARAELSRVREASTRQRIFDAAERDEARADVARLRADLAADRAALADVRAALAARTAQVDAVTALCDESLTAAGREGLVAIVRADRLRAALATGVDPETFCPRCLAGTESGQHLSTCGAES